MSEGNGVQQEIPYKELDYFEESAHDRERFAGRDHDIEEVVARISSTRAFVLYGRSGLGKTSLLLSGVFPILRKEGFLPIYVRTLDQPLQGLEKILRHPCSGFFDPPARDDESLEDLLRRAGGKSIPVLVFDQFEEFFTRFALRTDGFLKKRRDRTEFVNRICALVLDLARDIRIVFSLREDYLHTLDAFQRRLPNLFSTAYRLLPLTAEGARDAIIRPLRRDGVAFDQRAVTGLVDQLAEFDFESARLQVASAELYLSARGARDGKVSITADDLGRLQEQGVSGLAGVFKRYLQAAIEHIEERWHLLARALLDVLFLAKGTKFALSSRELVDYKFGTALETLDVLRQLTRQKILRRERRDGRTWFELRHECLVEPIEEWLNESESFGNYRQVRDIIKANARGGRFRTHPEMLLSTDQLDRLVSPNKERFRLSAQEIEFVTLSAIYERAPDVGWWAEKLGKEETEKLLTGLLADESNHKMLLGAAVAAGIIRPKDPEISRRCGAIALNEKLPFEVCRGAGASFALLAPEDQISALRPKVRWWRTKKPVMELLADLHKENRLQKHFAWNFRFIARRKWERRVIDQNAAAIREAAGEGMMAGAWGGVIWAATAGAVMSFVIGNITDSFFVFFWIQVGFVVAALALGYLFGLVFGRAAAQEALVRGFADWGRSMRRPFTAGLVCGVFPLAALFVFTDYLDSTGVFSGVPNGLLSGLITVAALATFFGGGRLVLRLLSWGARFCRYTMLGQGPARALLWAVPAFLTVGLLPSLFLYTVSCNAHSYLPPWFAIAAELCSLLLMIAVATFNVVDKRTRDPIDGDLNRRLQKNMRMAAWGGMVLVLPWYVFAFGWTSLPLPSWWLTHERETNGRLACSAHFKTWPTVARFLIEGDDLVYNVENGPSAILNGQYCHTGAQLFLPERRGEIVLLRRFYNDDLDETLYLQAEKFATGEGVDLSVGPILAFFKFSPMEENGKVVWKNTLGRSVDHATDSRRGRYVKVSLFENTLTTEAGAGSYYQTPEPIQTTNYREPLQTFRARSAPGVLNSAEAIIYVPLDESDSLRLPLELIREDGSKSDPQSFSMIVRLERTMKKD